MPSTEVNVPYDAPDVVDYFAKTVAMASNNYYVTYQGNDSIVFQFSQDANWGIFILLSIFIWTIPFALIYLLTAKKSGSAHVYVTQIHGGSHIRVDYDGSGVWSVAQRALQGLKAYETTTVQSTTAVSETNDSPPKDTNSIEAEAISERVCEACGVSLLEGDNFCVSCGTSVVAPVIEAESSST